MLNLESQNDAVYSEANLSRSEQASYSISLESKTVISADRECLPFPEMEFNFDDLEEILAVD